MVMVGVDSDSLQVDSQPKSSGLVLGWRPLGAILHSSNEPDKLSQWLCDDDSTINIGICIIIHQNYHKTVKNSASPVMSALPAVTSVCWQFLASTCKHLTNHYPVYTTHNWYNITRTPEILNCRQRTTVHCCFYTTHNRYNITRTSEILNCRQRATVHCCFWTRPSFWAYLAPIKISR